MKIEAEIPDITQEQVVDAMASHVLSQQTGERARYDDPHDMAGQLCRAVRVRIDELASEAVRQLIDDTIRSRIAAKVDEVIAAGWRKTDSYGNATGDAIDLKGRINEIITEKKGDGYSGPKFTLAEKLVRDTVQAVFEREFKTEVNAACTQLRRQLETTVQAKFVEAIKSALGVR